MNDSPLRQRFDLNNDDDTVEDLQWLEDGCSLLVDTTTDAASEAIRGLAYGGVCLFSRLQAGLNWFAKKK